MSKTVARKFLSRPQLAIAALYITDPAASQLPCNIQIEPRVPIKPNP
jgi:hypothetical protein